MGGFDPYSITADPRNAYLAGDPVNVATGDFTHEHTDLFIPGKGIPLEFTRVYHSGSGFSRSLGVGWSHNYDFYLTFNSLDVSVFYPNGHAVLFEESSGTYTPRAGVFDTLVKDGSTYVFTTTTAVEYTFDSEGKLTSITDRNGNVTTLTYDANDYLEEVEDPGGRSLTLSVDGNGRITEVEDPLGRTVGFDYTGTDLTEVTDVKAGITTYAYSQHRMTSLTDANDNAQVENVYDAAGRVVEQSDVLGNITCYYFGAAPSYTSANCPSINPSPAADETIMVDARAKKTTYAFGSSSLVESVTDHDGGVTGFEYDANFNRICITDPLGHKTGFAYDSAGNLTGVIDAENTDANCDLDTGGVQWTYTYTSLNDLDLETDPLGRRDGLRL